MQDRNLAFHELPQITKFYSSRYLTEKICIIKSVCDATLHLIECWDDHDQRRPLQTFITATFNLPTNICNQIEAEAHTNFICMIQPLKDMYDAATKENKARKRQEATKNEEAACQERIAACEAALLEAKKLLPAPKRGRPPRSSPPQPHSQTSQPTEPVETEQRASVSSPSSSFDDSPISSPLYSHASQPMEPERTVPFSLPTFSLDSSSISSQNTWEQTEPIPVPNKRYQTHSRSPNRRPRSPSSKRRLSRSRSPRRSHFRRSPSRSRHRRRERSSSRDRGRRRSHNRERSFSPNHQPFMGTNCEKKRSIATTTAVNHQHPVILPDARSPDPTTSTPPSCPPLNLQFPSTPNALPHDQLAFFSQVAAFMNGFLLQTPAPPASNSQAPDLTQPQ